MAEREPVETTNLDQHGETALSWSVARDRLVSDMRGPGVSAFLGTIGPGGTPHSAGVGAVWVDGNIYVVAGPGTRKARNLAANPACMLSVGLTGIDVVVEAEATRVPHHDELEEVAAIYREIGWPAEVEGEAFTAPYTAPSAGPAPLAGGSAAEPLAMTRLSRDVDLNGSLTRVPPRATVGKSRDTERGRHAADRKASWQNFSAAPDRRVDPARVRRRGGGRRHAG